jgi:two-component system sensor kinase FixL
MMIFTNFPYRDLWNRRWVYPFLALAALTLALGMRLAPGAGDRIWLLALVGLALAPAALPGVVPILTTLVLSIVATVLFIPGTGTVEGLLLAAAALLLNVIADGVRDAPATRLAVRLDRRWRANVLGDMTATLTHDLTQPLTAAAAYLQAGQTQLGRTGPDHATAGVAPILGLVRDQLLRASGLLGEFRERLVPDPGERRPERVSHLIRALRPVVTAMGAAAGVAVTVRVETRDDRVLVDGIQIQQAMLNLVRNAIDSVAGQAERAVTLRGRSISTDHYEITVEDTGHGITPDSWNQIVHPSMNKALEGRALGLSVTRTILKNHDSRLAVRPTATGGSGFHFSLARVAEPGVPA